MPLLPPALPRRPVPLVTVSFRPDIQMLRLQARSFALYLAPEAGRRILVVNNDTDEDAFAGAFEAEVLPEYGPHRPQVELLSRRQVLEGFDTASGWRRQQLLKWAMARVVEPGLYLTLDSKNCLVRPWRDADLFTAEGRIRMLRRRLSGTLAESFHYFVPPAAGADGADRRHIAHVWTPYALVTRHVIAMTEEMQRREGVPAYELLATRQGFLEYALYWSYLVSMGADGLYDLHTPTFFAGFWFLAEEDPETVFQALEQPAVAWFALHRRIKRARPELRARIAALLAERGLLAGTESATAWVEALPAA